MRTGPSAAFGRMIKRSNQLILLLLSVLLAFALSFWQPLLMQSPKTAWTYGDIVILAFFTIGVFLAIYKSSSIFLTPGQDQLIEDLLRAMRKGLKLASKRSDIRITLRTYDTELNGLRYRASWPRIDAQNEKDNRQVIPCAGKDAEMFVVAQAFNDRLAILANAGGVYPSQFNIAPNLRSVLAAPVFDYEEIVYDDRPLGALSCDFSTTVEDTNIDSEEAKQMALRFAFLVFKILSRRY
jgi:hypothetical protein